MSESHVPTALQLSVDYLREQGIITKDLEISERTGYSPGAVSTYISGNTKPSKPFLKKFEEVFGLKLSNFVKEQQNNPMNVVSQKPDYGQDMTMNTVSDLARSNSLLAESNKSIAEAYKILAASNADLVGLVKKLNSDGQKETPSALDSIIPGILEFLVESSISSYKSKEEATAALHRSVYGSKSHEGKNSGHN